MNKSKILTIFFAVFSLFLMQGCGSSSGKKKGGGTKNFKSQTGWKENDSKGWFFSGKPSKNVKAWPGMVYIEGGSFTMGQVKDDVMHDWNNTPQRMQVSSFFIGETEVTNHDYRSYLTWLRVVFPPEEAQFKNIYQGALPNPEVFQNKLSSNSFDATKYLMSPEYSYYPVVGVTWLQAVNYCDWLTDRANEKDLVDKGLLGKDYYSNEEYNYGTSYFDAQAYLHNDTEVPIDTTKLQKTYKISSTNSRVIAANQSTRALSIAPFRLPTEAEWEYAALALPGNREYNLYQGKDIAQNDLRGKKGKNRGLYMANLKGGRGDYSGIGGYGNDAAALTSDVKQYPSNSFGVYGMDGNVAEWVADVYRPIIDTEASDFNYYRGNVFKNYIDNSGAFERTTVDNMEYDTLDNGQLVYRSLPGKYKTEVTGDYVNLGDGDKISSLNYGEEGETSTQDMYNSPQRSFRVDEDGKIVLEKDPQTRTSFISDEIRVVKGGSWSDPIYWLDPGQRRFLHQAEATSWIGFRVAQDYQGIKDVSRSRRGSDTK